MGTTPTPAPAAGGKEKRGFAPLEYLGHVSKKEVQAERRKIHDNPCERSRQEFENYCLEGGTGYVDQAHWDEAI